MQRRAATALHLALFGIGAALYIVFVLPRWWVLTGDLPSTAAMVGRIAAGVPIAAAAVPIMLNLRRALQPGFRTPELALRMRAWSAVMHVLAGILIILASTLEIWLGLGAAGPWLFAVYGAAAAIALLGFAAFQLSYAAEKPPAEAKPPKPAKEKKGKRRGRKRGSPAEDSAEDQDPVETEDPAESEAEAEVKVAVEAAPTETPEKPTSEVVETPDVESEVTETADVEPALPETDKPAGLRNKRPSGKVRNRRPG